MTNLNKPSMTLPEVTVFLDGSDDVHTVRPTLGDMAKYDVVRSRKQWPKRDDAEVLFLVGITYLALRRIGKVPSSLTVDDFVDQIATFEVEGMDDDDTAAEDAQDDAAL